MTSSTVPTVRSYDIIAYGDEVPGILSLVAAVREYRRQTSKTLRTLLIFQGYSLDGIGGHLVRGGLAYLDRCQVPLDVRQSLNLGTFGDPPVLYQEFLRRAGVKQIALDPRQADSALRSLLKETSTDILSQAEIESVTKEGAKLTGIRLKSHNALYRAQQFIDSTVNAQLAQAAGVRKLTGFETFGLPESELPVTLVFETTGLSIQRLKFLEQEYIQRFHNPSDTQAQHWLKVATNSNSTFAEQLKQGMVDAQGRLRTLYVGSDYIDVRCRALSIAYHGWRGTPMSMALNSVMLDQANIAILPGDRLSWNALLFRVTGSQAETLARNGAKPTPPMLQEMEFVSKWFKSLGAMSVKPALELYIRHAGNITNVVEPLSGSRMLEGGVSVLDAVGTFGYHLDVRGGIEGLGVRAAQIGLNSVAFHSAPLFNVGFQHALVRTVPNLAVVSPASGFRGYACAAGRIVEFNVGVGQGVGIAASLALLSRRNLADIRDWEVRQILAKQGLLPRIYGRGNYQEASRLLAFETSLGSGIAIA